MSANPNGVISCLDHKVGRCIKKPPPKSKVGKLRGGYRKSHRPRIDCPRIITRNYSGAEVDAGDDVSVGHLCIVYARLGLSIIHI